MIHWDPISQASTLFYFKTSFIVTRKGTRTFWKTFPNNSNVIYDLWSLSFNWKHFHSQRDYKFKRGCWIQHHFMHRMMTSAENWQFMHLPRAETATKFSPQHLHLATQGLNGLINNWHGGLFVFSHGRFGSLLQSEAPVLVFMWILGFHFRFQTLRLLMHNSSMAARAGKHCKVCCGDSTPPLDFQSFKESVCSLISQN